MRLFDFLETYILPNLWGSLAVSVAWIAQNIKNRKKDRADTDGALLDNARKVIEMAEGLTQRINDQNEKLTDQIEKERRALLDMTDLRNDCVEQLRIVNGLKIDLERSLQIRDKELEEFKATCKGWRKLIGYEKDIIVADSSNVSVVRCIPEDSENSG